MSKHIRQLLSLCLCLAMLLGAMPVSAMAMETVDQSEMVLLQPVMDSGDATEGAEPEDKTELKENNAQLEEVGDEPRHWLQQYQEWAVRQAMMRSSSSSYSLISWENSTDAGTLHFANGAWLKSPLPKIYLNGDIAFCGEWNGATPSGNYEQAGTGSDTVIKQILANYDKSGKSSSDYAAAQVAIWARLMGTSVSSWGNCPGQASYNAIRNGTNDYSNLKYNYISWSGGTQDLITYNVDESEGPEEPEDPDLPEYPEDEYRIEVETDTRTETEVRHSTSYEYSDAIGQITIRKHDQDGKSLDGALFNIDVAFSDGSHTTVENWEVDNGARLFTWTHPKDNHDPATVTVTEIEPPRYYYGDPTPQTAVVAPTYTRVTHVETWTVTIVTETTSSTVIEIASGEVVAESESSSSAETSSEPQVEEYADFIAGDRETTVTFVNTKIECDLIISKIDEDTGKPLEGAVFRVAKRGGKEFTDVTTNASGLAIVDGLDSDWYQVAELRAPTGYVLENTHHDIEIIAGETATLVVKNSSKPDLTVSKIDSVTKEPMQGVVFEIAVKNGKSLGEFTTDAQGLITLHDVEPNETYIITELRTLDGYLIDEPVKEITLGTNENVTVPFEDTPENPILIKKLDDVSGAPIEDTTFLVTKVNGEFVGEYTTGKQGYATVAGIDPGWYVVKEIRANPNYIPSSEAKTVQLKVGEPAVVEFYNRPKTGLQVIKTDAVTGEPLKGVKFTVTELSGAVVGTYETDKDGIIYLDGLEEKWVRVTEIQPLPGYKPDPEPRLIELKSDKLNILEYENQPYPVLQITKIDADSKEPLAGVKLRLYDSQKREIGTYTTNEQGLIVLTGMDGGQALYVREVEALEGYELDDTYYKAELDWGKTTQIEIKNALKPLTVTVEKYGNHEVVAGDVMRYDFKNIANTSETHLDDFYWHEALPTDAVRIGEIVTGTWSDKLQYSITYCTNKSDDYEVAEDGLYSNVSYDVDLSAEALHLKRGEYVTDVRFEFGTVPAGFHEVKAPEFYVTTLASLADGYRIINRTDTGGQRNGKWAVYKDTWVTVVWNTPKTDLPKTGY